MKAVKIIIGSFILLLAGNISWGQCYFDAQIRTDAQIVVGSTDIIGTVYPRSDGSCGGGMELHCSLVDSTSGFHCSVQNGYFVGFSFHALKTGQTSTSATIHLHTWRSGSDCCWRDTSLTLTAYGIGQQSVSSDARGNTIVLNGYGASLPLRIVTLNSNTVTMQLFDLTGRLVRQIERDVPAGTSEIDLDASSLPPGCYWYVVRGKDWTKSGKVMKLP